MTEKKQIRARERVKPEIVVDVFDTPLDDLQEGDVRIIEIMSSGAEYTYELIDECAPFDYRVTDMSGVILDALKKSDRPQWSEPEAQPMSDMQDAMQAIAADYEARRSQAQHRHAEQWSEMMRFAASLDVGIQPWQERVMEATLRNATFDDVMDTAARAEQKIKNREEHERWKRAQFAQHYGMRNNDPEAFRRLCGY